MHEDYQERLGKTFTVLIEAESLLPALEVAGEFYARSAREALDAYLEGKEVELEDVVRSLDSLWLTVGMIGAVLSELAKRHEW